MSIQITNPEIEALIEQRLRTGGFSDVEDVILQALRESDSSAIATDERRAAAIDRLKSFGEANGLSLDGLTIADLRRESRP